MGEYRWTFNLQGSLSFLRISSRVDRFDQYLAQYDKFSNPFKDKNGRLCELVVDIGLVQAWMLRTESLLRSSTAERTTNSLQDSLHLRSARGGRRSSSNHAVKTPSEKYPIPSFLDDTFAYFCSPVSDRTLKKLEKDHSTHISSLQ